MTSTTVTIVPVLDEIAEGDETVVVSVVASAGYTVGAPSTATGTITNVTSAPSGPTSFRITGMTGNQVSLAWALPASDVTATGVLLEGGLTPGAAAVIGQVRTLAPATTVTLPTGSYYLRARLMTAAGLSAPSNEAAQDFTNSRLIERTTPPRFTRSICTSSSSAAPMESVTSTP